MCNWIVQKVYDCLLNHTLNAILQALIWIAIETVFLYNLLFYIALNDTFIMFFADYCCELMRNAVEEEN